MIRVHAPCSRCGRLDRVCAQEEFLCRVCLAEKQQAQREGREFDRHVPEHDWPILGDALKEDEQ